ncbi:hypothetical protein [Agarivorans sp. 1_MG-2023]|uniref:hypothetical protein n=1 Tax=Agarivorans sp. 1_MG-2023 TaxID=3062634 RepID=UPI0026E1FF94|nr:hypothetical protein [Agarivorans sp. 1_MG-2023]MDO6762045.1 hypothetical protein [Agarivorans sp. 1_MG-2023]
MLAKGLKRISLIALLFTISHVHATKFEPDNDSILVFVGQDNDTVGGHADYRNGYIDHFGKPAGLTHYVYFGEGGTLNFELDKHSYTFATGRIDGLNHNDNWGAGPMCLKCYLDSPELKDMMVHIAISMQTDAEKKISTGKLDHLLDEFSTFMAAYPERQFFLRIGYEFDAPWNNYDPQAFQQAFRRIVDHLRSRNIDNFATVMQSSTMHIPAKKWKQFWPGDDYVDWIGYALFRPLSAESSANPVAHRLAKSKKLPVFVAEWAAHDYDTSNPNPDRVWRFFEWSHNFFELNQGLIKAVSYINTDWPTQPMWNVELWKDHPFGPWHNSQLQANPNLMKRWTELMETARYIHDPKQARKLTLRSE